MGFHHTDQNASDSRPWYVSNYGQSRIHTSINTSFDLYGIHSDGFPKVDAETAFENMMSNMSIPCGNWTVFNASDCNQTGNGTDDSDADHPLPFSLWLTVILALLVACVSIMTVLGNLMVVLSFAIERSIRQPTNYFIASLAVSDLLIGTFSMPCFTLYLLIGYWPLGEIVCDLWLSLDWTVCLASQYTVFFITVDRFFSVKIPAKYRNWRSERKVIVMVAFTWIIPMLVFFTSIIGWQYFVGKRTVKPYHCEVQFMSDPLFTFLLTIGYYWTTLIVMCGLYTGIYRVALNLQRKSEAKQKKMSSAMNMQKDNKKKTRSTDNGAASKKSRKRIENNNARHVRGAAMSTTSFSRPSEEDRSSSPAFASDEENSSSGAVGGQANSHTCLTTKSVVDDDGHSGFTNSAAQTDAPYKPASSLKGMLGVSFNHVSLMALTMSGAPPTTEVRSEDTNEENKTEDEETKDPFDDEHEVSFQPIQECESDKEALQPMLQRPEPKRLSRPWLDCEDEPGLDKDNPDLTLPDAGNENDDLPTLSLIESEILQGCRYIDEDSLKSLTSTENVRLLSSDSSVPPVKVVPTSEESSSPVWKKRPGSKNLRLSKTSKPNLGSDVIEVNVDDSHATTTDETDQGTLVRSAHGMHVVGGDNIAVPKHEHLKPSASNDSRMSSNNSKQGRKFASPLQQIVKTVRERRSKRKIVREKKSKSENRARKALRTITFILGAYIICWTPYHIMLFIIGVCGDFECVNPYLYNFTYWLCYLNSPINPFCYAFANVQFKRTFLRILKFDWHRT